MHSTGESEPSELPLTEEQVAALQAGPGLVTNPALDPYRPEEHNGDLNNFRWHFRNNLPGVKAAYCQKAYYQRFQIIYPEIANELEMRTSTEGVMSDETLEMLIKAYRLMSSLVDTNDQGVLRDGELDRYILIR